MSPTSGRDWRAFGSLPTVDARREIAVRQGLDDLARDLLPDFVRAEHVVSLVGDDDYCGVLHLLWHVIGHPQDTRIQWVQPSETTRA